MFYEGLYLYQKTGDNTARTLYILLWCDHTCPIVVWKLKHHFLEPCVRVCLSVCLTLTAHGMGAGGGQVFAIWLPAND